MPAIETPSHVLVTGASGYIASWTCQELLYHGHHVRGTVRNQAKGEYLSNLFSKYGNRWSFVIVEDVERPIGFDEALIGIDGVVHIASPCRLNITDPYKDLIHPAVNGTLSILESANGPNGKSVKRIVITSSFAAVRHPTDDPSYIFSEKDWNQHSIQLVQEMGPDTPPDQAYFASKVLAEKAAWKFIEEKKPSWDLITICPPFVLGPIIHDVKTSDQLNTSVKFFYNYLLGETNLAPLLSGPPIVDVRDLAIAQSQALLVERAGGHRFAISKQSGTWQDMLDVVNESDHVKYWPKALKGNPGQGKFVQQNGYDNSKSIEYLKLDYRSFDSTILDMSSSLAELSKKW